MFKKAPYGVKVRVKGNDSTGYVAQYAICCSRFFPSQWTTLVLFKNGKEIHTFDTLDEAQTVAMHEYDRWIEYYKQKEARKKQLKAVAKLTAWEHP